VLAPLPGTTIGNRGEKADLQSYIPGIFNLIIGLAAVIAVTKIIFGGFQYITTDAIAGKSEGKKQIQSAVYGLIMIIASWLILYTINPRLLTFDLNVGTVNVPEAAVTSGTLAATVSCNDCIHVTDGSIEFRNTGTNLSAGIIPQTTSLDFGMDNNGINWWISEGNPPTGTHRDPCHNNGTCFDAKIDNMLTLNKDRADEINIFIREAKQSQFSVVSFEVTSQEHVAEWAKLGVTAIYNENATGPHFHVEK